jgi:hypothetical protein
MLQNILKNTFSLLVSYISASKLSAKRTARLCVRFFQNKTFKRLRRFFIHHFLRSVLDFSKIVSENGENELLQFLQWHTLARFLSL